jgi:hypothetical protein
MMTMTRPVTSNLICINYSLYVFRSRLQLENNRMQTTNVHDAAAFEHLNTRFYELESSIANQEMVD